MRISIAPRIAVAVVAALSVLAGVAPAPASAYPDRPSTPTVDGACEGELLRLHNAARTRSSLPALREDPAFDQVARAWAFRLATEGTLRHNPSFGTEVGSKVPGWTSIGENVGVGPSGSSLHTAYMNSSGHRANIMATKYQRIAVGCVRDQAGRAWTAVNFVGHRTAIPDRRPAPFFSAGDASGRLRWWLLGASPDRAAVESDTASLLAGRTTYVTLASALAVSNAHTATVPAVTRLYYATFLRHPDAPGLTHWIRARQGGTSVYTITRGFAVSQEFEERYGILDNREFVEQIYRNVLRREADEAGSDYWIRLLDAGGARWKVLTGFSESAEHKRITRADVIVSWAYIQMVDREATALERTAWTTLLGTGGTERTIVESLSRSSEFASRVGTLAY